MSGFVIRRVSGLKGSVSIPGDKSVAHRAVILGALSKGKTVIENFPFNEDCLSTVVVFKQLGISINKRSESVIEVKGNGLYGLRKAVSPIFVGESGTTFRLMTGLLAGQGFKTELVAGKVLSGRPMLRVTRPLRLMGADIAGCRRNQDEYPPLTIQGKVLHSITYRLPVASAQVKGAILLAGLYASGKTKVIEQMATRDHTERMMQLFKAKFSAKGNVVMVKGGGELVSPRKIYVPGDISSAAFFMVAAAIVPGSEITIKNITLNPSRMGIVKVLKRMGVKLTVKGKKVSGREPMGDIVVRSSILKATTISKDEVPSLIDEIPVLMVAAALAKGKTVFKEVGELRVKETDRIRSMTENLRKMGGKIIVLKAGDSESIEISGTGLKGSIVKSFGDHRTAMSMIVAGLAAAGPVKIEDISCIKKSFPGFVRAITGLTGKLS
ncbi:MAG: 3-phosphoshikimate 1-carboxyvinyltransferase [Candidatus Omnitrophica bacterium]|nr:3-phosphoshikimate 1-carboxyvinyltransferase [Candidatus Omnitrophota bacterium]